MSSQSIQEEVQHQGLFPIPYTDNDNTSKATILWKKVHPIDMYKANEGETVSGYSWTDLEILNNVFQLLCCPT